MAGTPSLDMNNEFTVAAVGVFGKAVVLASMSIAALTSCHRSDKHLLIQLHQELTPLDTMTTGYRKLNLDSLTDFAWDRVYFFRGDTSPEFISKEIGFSWSGPAVYHTDRRLLFVRQQEVVAYVDCSRALARSVDEPFLPISMYQCPTDKSAGIPRKQAKFAVYRTCDGAFITYAMAPLNCLSHFQDDIVEGCQDYIDPKSSTKHTADSVKRDFMRWNERKIAR
jgi:hypothetical protein